MFWVVTESKNKMTFGTIDELFSYVNTNNIVEGFAGYKL